MSSKETEAEIKKAAMEVVDVLRPMKLTIADVRRVLEYIGNTIEDNVILQ